MINIYCAHYWLIASSYATNVSQIGLLQNNSHSLDFHLKWSRLNVWHLLRCCAFSSLTMLFCEVYYTKLCKLSIFWVFPIYESCKQNVSNQSCRWAPKFVPYVFHPHKLWGVTLFGMCCPPRKAFWLAADGQPEIWNVRNVIKTKLVSQDYLKIKGLEGV